MCARASAAPDQRPQPTPTRTPAQHSSERHSFSLRRSDDLSLGARRPHPVGQSFALYPRRGTAAALAGRVGAVSRKRGGPSLDPSAGGRDASAHETRSETRGLSATASSASFRSDPVGGPPRGVSARDVPPRGAEGPKSRSRDVAGGSPAPSARGRARDSGPTG